MRALGFPVKKAEVKRIMAEVDVDGSGTIELPEFIRISASPPPRAAQVEVQQQLLPSSRCRHVYVCVCVCGYVCVC